VLQATPKNAFQPMHIKNFVSHQFPTWRNVALFQPYKTVSSDCSNDEFSIGILSVSSHPQLDLLAQGLGFWSTMISIVGSPEDYVYCTLSVDFLGDQVSRTVFLTSFYILAPKQR
jgi:hypothetical protein